MCKNLKKTQQPVLLLRNISLLFSVCYGAGYIFSSNGSGLAWNANKQHKAVTRTHKSFSVCFQSCTFKVGFIQCTLQVAMFTVRLPSLCHRFLVFYSTMLPLTKTLPKSQWGSSKEEYNNDRGLRKELFLM